MLTLWRRMVVGMCFIVVVVGVCSLSGRTEAQENPVPAERFQQKPIIDINKHWWKGQPRVSSQVFDLCPLVVGVQSKKPFLYQCYPSFTACDAQFFVTQINDGCMIVDLPAEKGTVWCKFGSAYPERAKGIAGAVLLASGGGYSCAVTAGNGIGCWEQGGAWTPADGIGPWALDSPQALTDVVDDYGSLVGLAAGTSHTCILNAEGKVWCWGLNSSGQLGSVTEGNSTISPVLATAFTGTAKTITAGHAHTCITDAVGTVQCWGDNSFGQLGTDLPKSPGIALSDLSGVQSIDSSDRTTCVVDGSGHIFCWGYGLWYPPSLYLSDEVLADATPSDTVKVPKLAKIGFPIPWLEGETYTQVRVMHDGVCGVTTAGAIICDWAFPNQAAKAWQIKRFSLPVLEQQGAFPVGRGWQGISFSDADGHIVISNVFSAWGKSNKGGVMQNIPVQNSFAIHFECNTDGTPKE